MLFKFTLHYFIPKLFESLPILVPPLFSFILLFISRSSHYHYPFISHTKVQSLPHHSSSFKILFPLLSFTHCFPTRHSFYYLFKSHSQGPYSEIHILTCSILSFPFSLLVKIPLFPYHSFHPRHYIPSLTISFQLSCYYSNLALSPTLHLTSFWLLNVFITTCHSFQFSTLMCHQLKQHSR